MESPESPLEEGEVFCSALCNWSLRARFTGRFPACGQDRSLPFLEGQSQKLHWTGSLSLHDVSPCSVLGVASNLGGLGWVLLKYKLVGTHLQILAELCIEQKQDRFSSAGEFTFPTWACLEVAQTMVQDTLRSGEDRNPETQQHTSGPEVQGANSDTSGISTITIKWNRFPYFTGP